MNRYIATFYSHFGAMSYYNTITKQGISAKLMPVPRKVSSSCGTCVSYQNSIPLDLDDCELECVYTDVDNALICEIMK
jgi:hypothetical protein